jgi:hypothetical protein
MLPEIPLVAQDRTLLVPRMVFREGQQITLSRHDQSHRVKLRKQVASTGYFSQMNFDYTHLPDSGRNTDAEHLPSAFDSIWNDI